MKKIIILINLFIFCLVLHSQRMKVKVEYNKNIDDPFFHTNDSIYNPMTLVFKDETGRLHYDNVPDSNKYATQANIILNNDENRQIRFGNVRRGDDVFYITLEEYDPAESLSLNLVIKGADCVASFSSGTPMLGKAKVSLTSIKLVLNEMYPQKGDWVKGKVSFKAVSKSKYGYITYEGEGYFKCIAE